MRRIQLQCLGYDHSCGIPIASYLGQEKSTAQVLIRFLGSWCRPSRSVRTRH